MPCLPRPPFPEARCQPEVLPTSSRVGLLVPQCPPPPSTCPLMAGAAGPQRGLWGHTWATRPPSPHLRSGKHRAEPQSPALSAPSQSVNGGGDVPVGPAAQAPHLSLALQPRARRSPCPPCGTSPPSCHREKAQWRAPAPPGSRRSAARPRPPLRRAPRTAPRGSVWTRAAVRAGARGPGGPGGRGGGGRASGLTRPSVLRRLAGARRHRGHRHRRPAGHLRGAGARGRRAEKVFRLLKRIKGPRPGRGATRRHPRCAPPCLHVSARECVGERVGGGGRRARARGLEARDSAHTCACVSARTPGPRRSAGACAMRVRRRPPVCGSGACGSWACGALWAESSARPWERGVGVPQPPARPANRPGPALGRPLSSGPGALPARTGVRPRGQERQRPAPGPPPCLLRLAG